MSNLEFEAEEIDDLFGGPRCPLLIDDRAWGGGWVDVGA